MALLNRHFFTPEDNTTEVPNILGSCNTRIILLGQKKDRERGRLVTTPIFAAPAGNPLRDHPGNYGEIRNHLP